MELETGLSTLSTGLAQAGARVAPAIAEAAARTGVDFRTLFETARVESGLDPDARSRTSSATGLFQFIDRTWLAALGKHGPRHGITAKDKAQALDLRKDPGVAALMAAEHMAENGRVITGALGRAAGAVDLYLAHFLGAGGAVRFLKGLAEDPGQSASVLFPSAARANRGIFFDGGAPRSLAAVHALFERKLGLGANVPAVRAASVPDVPSKAAEMPAALEAQRAAQAAYLLLAGLGA
jgi:hypothetical protein